MALCSRLMSCHCPPEQTSSISTLSMDCRCRSVELAARVMRRARHQCGCHFLHFLAHVSSKPPRRALTLTQMGRCREVPPANQTVLNSELNSLQLITQNVQAGPHAGRVQVGHTSHRSMETSHGHAQNSWPGQAGRALLPAPRVRYQGQLQHRCCLTLQAARSLGSSQPDALHLRALLAGSCGCALRSPCIRRHASTIRSKSALWLPR